MPWRGPPTRTWQPCAHLGGLPQSRGCANAASEIRGDSTSVIAIPYNDRCLNYFDLKVVAVSPAAEFWQITKG